MRRQAQVTLGQSMVVVIITFFIVALGVFALAYVTSLSQLPDERIKPLTNYLYSNQLIGSPRCFAYEDARSGRVDRGVLDEKKLSNSTFNECLRLKDERIKSAKMTLITEEAQPRLITYSTTYWGGEGMTTDKFTLPIYLFNGTHTTPAKIILQMN